MLFIYIVLREKERNKERKKERKLHHLFWLILNNEINEIKQQLNNEFLYFVSACSNSCIWCTELRINCINNWSTKLEIHLYKDSLLYKVYAQQVNSLMQGSAENNWVFQIKSLLNELGFTYLWDNQTLTKLLVEMVIQCIYDQYFQSWYGAVNASSKLENLKMPEQSV